MTKTLFEADSAYIREAIKRELPFQQELHIRYRDDEHFRCIYPHIVYEGSNGRIKLNAYQIDNPNKPDDPAGWKDFMWEKIDDAIFADDEFATRLDFNPMHKKYCRIISSVDLPDIELHEKCDRDDGAEIADAN